MSESRDSKAARCRVAVRAVYQAFISVKVALALLVVVLASCVLAVTVFRGPQAQTLIFSTLWFNGLLALLAVASFAAFTNRVWNRRFTLISVGMIVFHMCFAAMLLGVIYNSLFRFEGVLRLTEGEKLPASDPQSYDSSTHGRLFEFPRLRGEAEVLKVIPNYTVDGINKKIAYEVSVGEPGEKQEGLIFVTHSMAHDGLQYFREKEGYSVLVVLHDQQGQELYGAYLPLQSLKMGEVGYLYTTGSPHGPGAFAFPQDEAAGPLMDLQVAFLPDPANERSGEVTFTIWPAAGSGEGVAPAATGRVPVGGVFRVGDYYLSAKEVRFWVGMTVRHDPGQPLILASLVAGLAGMILTFIGRIRQDAARRRARPHTDEVTT